MKEDEAPLLELKDDALCPLCMFDKKNGGHCEGPKHEWPYLPCGKFRPAEDCVPEAPECVTRLREAVIKMLAADVMAEFLGPHNQVGEYAKSQRMKEYLEVRMPRMVKCKNCRRARLIPYCEPGALWCNKRKIKVEMDRERKCEFYDL
jgi:hypothetical protein